MQLIKKSPGRNYSTKTISNTNTEYNLRSKNNDLDPNLSGKILTETSERFVKKSTLDKMLHEEETTSKMTHTHLDPVMMICYRECLTNLDKFTGCDEKRTIQFINNIERIGRMIKASDDILHCMCIAKLDGEAKRWYENNILLTEWKTLKVALLERFTSSDSTSRTFEQLKQRKQQPNESITSYYDDIIRLCQDYDPTMSQRLIISWLENGINEALKISVKRQMKTLPESTRTTQAFLKIAKDEEELQEHALIQPESTSSVVPYFTNTISTTLQRQQDRGLDPSKHAGAATQPTTYRNTNIQRGKQSSQNYHLEARQRSNHNGRHHFSSRSDDSTTTVERSKSSYPSTPYKQRFDPCIICQKKNHRTIDCYQKKASGCFKCGQSDHRVRDCPKVFY